jgi:putative addiction module component (TIGR02574 family)
MQPVTKAAEKILADALTLDTRERADVAAKLIASLDGEPDEDVEAAWAAEVARRIDDIEAGRVKLVPWEDVERRVEREILKR